MEKHVTSAILSMLATAVIFCSCERNAHEPEPAKDPEPPLSVTVLKLKKPEYKNYVLASRFNDSGNECFESLRGNLCKDPIGQSGYSPYWELSDNWLLVDWKWGDFPYAISAVLTEQTWDKYEWEGVTNSTKWSLTEPHEDNPIEKIHYIYIDHLETYSNTHYGEEMHRLISETIQDGIISSDGKCICDISDKMDSIWTVFQTELNNVIVNNDLEHINDRKYEPVKE